MGPPSSIQLRSLLPPAPPPRPLHPRQLHVRDLSQLAIRMLPQVLSETPYPSSAFPPGHLHPPTTHLCLRSVGRSRCPPPSPVITQSLHARPPCEKGCDGGAFAAASWQGPQSPSIAFKFTALLALVALAPVVHPRAVTSRPHAPSPRHARQVRVDTSLFALMRQFEKGRSHMALVVDPVRPLPGVPGRAHARASLGGAGLPDAGMLPDVSRVLSCLMWGEGLQGWAGLLWQPL